MTSAGAVCSAAALLAAAVWVGSGGGSGRLLLARVRPPVAGGGSLPRAGPRDASEAAGSPAAGRGWALVAAGAVAAGVWARRPLLALVVPLLAVAFSRARRAAAGARAAAGERDRVREFAAVLAAELRAGRPTRAAAASAARDVAVVPVPGPRARLAPGGWAPAVAAAAERGGDVAAALEDGAVRAGAAGLREVAACWRVAEGAGAGLAAGLDVVAAGLREREAHRREIAAQLAGVRASGYLLAALPGFGLLLGSALGTDPWRVLWGTAPGNAALAVGLALDVAGVAWLGRLARSAEETA